MQFWDKFHYFNETVHLIKLMSWKKTLKSTVLQQHYHTFSNSGIQLFSKQ